MIITLILFSYEQQVKSDDTAYRYQTMIVERDNSLLQLETEKNQLTQALEAERSNLVECNKVRTQLESEVQLLNEQVCPDRKIMFHNNSETNKHNLLQLVVYKTDFEIERTSRQDLASEREDLLSDLKLLQRRNAELLEQAQRT